MKQEQKLLKFNTVEQSNLVLHQIISQGLMIQVFQFAKQGYLINPFVLNLLYSFGYKNKLEEILNVAPNIHADCYNWLLIYWGTKKTNDFFVKINHTEVIKDHIDSSVLLEYELYDVLLERKKFTLLAENGHFDLLVDYIKKHPEKSAPYLILSQYKRFEELYQLKGYGALRESKLGILFLATKGEWDYLSKDLSSYNEYLYELFYKNKQSKYLLLRARSILWLKEQGHFEVFVEAKDWFSLHDIEKYELIDWTDFQSKISKYWGGLSDKAKMYLVKTKQWDILAQNHCRAILFKNWKFKLWAKSFFA